MQLDGSGTERRWLLLFSMIVIVPCSARSQQGGYSDRMSVSVGDSIGFHISTSISPFAIAIFRQDSVKVPVAFFPSIKGGVRSLPDSASWYGCGWPVSLTLVVPNSWLPGVYTAEFPCAGSTRSILFSVRERVPGSYSNILVGLTENTWQAYNMYGSHSLYHGPAFYKVTFDRPFDSNYGTGTLNALGTWTKPFLAWLERENLKVEIATNFDLHADPGLLDNYSVYIIVGHDEYWSRPEREQIERFVQRGGKLMILAGNTCWWQVRYENGGRTLVCYKDAAADPLTGQADSLVTVNWYAPPVNDPENALTGVSFRHGGYVNDPPDPTFPRSDGYGDFEVFNSQHWVYQGTGLNDGDEFGWNAGIVGYETDGALYAWNNGIPTVTGLDSTPASFTILGFSPASLGRSTMGIYRNQQGGAVFNTSTSNWVLGLDGDPMVRTITENVLGRFLENRFPPDIQAWYPSRVFSDSLNHHLVYLNKRSLAIPEGASVRFGVQAVDPTHPILHFLWKVNDEYVADDSTYNFTGLAGDTTTIVALAFNPDDTTFVRWRVYNTKLRIVSVPPAPPAQAAGYYYYKVDAASYYRDLLTYTIVQGPPWLSVDTDGRIKSQALQQTGDFAVTVRVMDQHDNSDTQTFVLVVSNATDVVEAGSGIPSIMKLLQNYPNPFNPGTTIRYQLSHAVHVSLKVYNTLGQEVATLVDGDEEAGNYEARFNGIGLASGIYYYRLRAGDFTTTKNSLLLK